MPSRTTSMHVPPLKQDITIVHEKVTPISHLSPEYSGEHWHVWLLPSTQVPPLRHTTKEQLNTTKEETMFTPTAVNTDELA